MWTWKQATGELVDGAGVTVGRGYSGDCEHYNNPASQEIPGVGPIPRGRYIIGNFFDDPGGKGPVVCRLTPIPPTNTFGRSGFMIHGDSADNDHSASHGCIVLAHALRAAISSSGDSILEVV